MENMYDRNVHKLHDSNDRFMDDDDNDDDRDEAVRNYILVTPTEEDIDELMECIQNGGTEDGNQKPMDHHYVNEIAECLMKQCHIHNWRELANAEPEIMYETLLDYKTEVEDTTKDGWSINHIEKWIDYAQQQSLYEIMYEICDDPNNDDVIELLQNGVNSGTPKDLAMWYPIIPQLQKELENYQQQLIIDSKEDEGVGNEIETTGIRKLMILPSYKDLKKWSYKCQRVLEQLDWLNDYVTPVE